MRNSLQIASATLAAGLLAGGCSGGSPEAKCASPEVSSTIYEIGGTEIVIPIKDRQQKPMDFNFHAERVGQTVVLAMFRRSAQGDLTAYDVGNGRDWMAFEEPLSDAEQTRRGLSPIEYTVAIPDGTALVSSSLGLSLDRSTAVYLDRYDLASQLAMVTDNDRDGNPEVTVTGVTNSLASNCYDDIEKVGR